ncbi:ankyrin repeat-containing domain, PGG domain protein, partial [Tanacetum coccineum]
YSLVYEIGSVKEMMDSLKDKRNNNNMWHLAAMRAKKTRLEDVSGVALQMQRELLWFMEVEAMMPLIFREKKNMDGLLLSDYLFTMEHADLLSARPIYMVVSALIATIAFAASFTIPGGYDQNSGIPIFLRKQSLKIFVISDSLSLTFSTISILIFLSILTSRYAEHDFLESLPKRLMRGLATLFLSIIAMMVTFSVSFFLLFHDKLIWVPIVISIFASTPVLIYARLQYSLLVDVYHSTYGSKNLFRPKKLKLYYQNPKY